MMDVFTHDITTVRALFSYPVIISTVIYRTPSKTFFAILASGELKVIFGFVLVFDMG
ncbi:hypothetical protein [Pseudoalteromonas rhizosphaerae]|uniref:hypothetical protein n=1 Tax=Pseudoalteromonas rhizosphaerae TaxID=2518973 RepID=UPI0021497302|nr:hypothetical protein [Pseudoalteromonas rhizosphaerae]